jgi:hypothetical protein
LLVSLFSCNLAVAGVPAVLVCIDIAGVLSTACVPALASPFWQSLRPVLILLLFLLWVCRTVASQLAFAVAFAFVGASGVANVPAAADVLALAMMLLIAFLSPVVTMLLTWFAVAVAGVELDVAVHQNQQIHCPL